MWLTGISVLLAGAALAQQAPSTDPKQQPPKPLYTQIMANGAANAELSAAQLQAAGKLGDQVKALNSQIQEMMNDRGARGPAQIQAAPSANTFQAQPMGVQQQQQPPSQQRPQAAPQNQQVQQLMDPHRAVSPEEEAAAKRLQEMSERLSRSLEEMKANDREQ